MEGQGTSLRRRLALLIDAENITDTGLVRRLLDRLERHGEVRIRRAYGDWSGERLRRWREALVQHAIQAVQVFPAAAGKNAADIALVVDAMDLLHDGDADGFCLLASDSDYTRLVVRLREADRYVIVAGRDATPLALRAAADLFLAVEPLGAQVPAAMSPPPEPLPALMSLPTGNPAPIPAPTPAAVEAPVPDEPVTRHPVRTAAPEAGAAKAGMPPLAVPAAGPSAREFRAVMQSVLHGGAWMALSNLANEVYARLPGCSPKRFGHATFGKLVMAQGDLVEHRPNPETPGGEVRLRTKGCRSDAAPLLREALTGKDWQALSAVGQALRKLEPGFNVRRYGHAQLQKLLRAHPQLIECRPASGTVQHVRLRA